MATTETEHVHKGWYIDHSQPWPNKWQWLVMTGWALFITSLLALFVSITLLRLYRIILQFTQARVKRDHQGYGGVPQRDYDEEDERHGHHRDERHGDHRDERDPGARGFYVVQEEISGLFSGSNAQEEPPGLFSGSIELQTPAAIDQAWRWKRLGRILLGVFWILVYLGSVAASVSTGFIAGGPRGLSAHPQCGIYRPRQTNNSWDKAYARARPAELEVEVESATYARNCYAGDDPDNCAVFITPSIAYETSECTCPFPEHMCYGNGTNAIKFSTGSIDSSTVGINAPVTFEFNRTTICSPLNMNSTYIGTESVEGKDITYGYYYGRHISLGNATWRTHRYNRSIGDEPFYSLSTLKSFQGWIPIAELQPPRNASTSIIFVLSHKIFYVQPSHDPVFPANYPYPQSPDPKNPWYWNFAGAGTVMACVDYKQWRDPSAGSTEWSSFTDLLDRYPPNSTIAAGQFLLWAGLSTSDIYQTISARGGDALDASRRIMGAMSQPLATEQWKTEAQSLFETSLARITVQIHRIARGKDAGRPDHELVDMGQLPLCDAYIFKTVGLVNISLAYLLTVTITCFFIVTLGSPKNHDKLWIEWLWENLSKFRIRKVYRGTRDRLQQRHGRINYSLQRMRAVICKVGASLWSRAVTIANGVVKRRRRGSRARRA